MKRPCPWDGDQEPLVKMHHSDKDQTLKTGCMESIYAKTLAKLFSGANKRTSDNNNLNEPIKLPMVAGSCVSCVRAPSPMRHQCVACSKHVCEDCHQVCSHCQQVVCGNCSLMNPMSSPVCLGCR